MTTEQQPPLSDAALEEELAILRRLLELRLDTLRAWVELPEERTDWRLESMLEEIRLYAASYRHLRNELDIPF